jgi:hypothetical protein
MRSLLLTVVLALLVMFGEACRSAQFDPASRVEAVRILATRADKPYAKPGDTVNLEVLAYDGRPQKPVPMNVWWVPIPCFNPPNDSYYACYPAFSALPAGVDLTPLLHAGTTFSFTMPANVIAQHTKRAGSVDSDPDGLAVVFSIACAGHVEFVRPVANSQNSLPLGCFDEHHVALGPDDYVFAFSLVYAFADRPNANPVVDHLTFGGATVDLKAGISLPACPAAAVDANGVVNRSRCPPTPMDIVVPDSTQEQDPGNPTADGRPRKESIRVQYFVTDGRFDHDTINLFDPLSGRISGTTNNFTAPAAPGEQMIWAVVRDNRGGVTWMQVPMHVR